MYKSRSEICPADKERDSIKSFEHLIAVRKMAGFSGLIEESEKSAAKDKEEWSTALNALKKGANYLVNGVKTTYNSIKSAVSAVHKKIADSLYHGANAAHAFFVDKFHWAKDALQGMRSLVDGFNGLLNTASNVDCGSTYLRSDIDQANDFDILEFLGWGHFAVESPMEYTGQANQVTWWDDGVTRG